MAGRPPKNRIDYSGWDVDIFDGDTKIDKLIDAQGAAGFLIYFYMCQKAYGSEGYYYKWSYDDAATTARKIGGGVGSETVKQTVALCLQIGLFDNKLFDREGVITSKRIQKQWWQVAKDRTIHNINPNYWLPEKTSKSGEPDKVTPKSNYTPPKLNYDTSKLNYEGHKVKDSKGIVKESIVKDSNTKPSIEDKSIISTDNTLPRASSLSELTEKCWDKFYLNYPKKVDKKKAYQKYLVIFKALKTEKAVIAKAKEILSGLKNYLNYWSTNETEFRYIPSPVVWLNKERWNDELQIQEPKSILDPLREAFKEDCLNETNHKG